MHNVIQFDNLEEKRNGAGSMGQKHSNKVDVDVVKSGRYTG